LDSGGGLRTEILELGAVVRTLHVPDREGRVADVVLGFDEPSAYLTQKDYFGAVVGRFANRIAHGRFVLDGHTYTLATNNGRNHLHGGDVGFCKRLWNGEAVESDLGPAVRFTYVSAAGEEGYPGRVEARVTYTLSPDTLIVDYEATTDAPTVVNLSQHSYFNLAGHDGGDVLDHRVQILAASFTPVDETLIPTGEIVAVAATPFDFRTPVTIGARIDADDVQLERAGGYDHNFVLDQADDLRVAAIVSHAASGRRLEISTDRPGVQFYSGNFLDGTVQGKNGVRYRHRTGFCLETQTFPDAPNRHAFPSATLRPGEVHKTRTTFKFSADA
jgi:aldose 1-epimerase